jgi:membrane protein
MVFRHPRVKRNFNFLYHVLRQADRHDVLGMAAEIGFQLMFALFQALIFMVSILSIVGAQPDVFNSIIRFLGNFLPFELYVLIRRQIVEIARVRTGGILAFSSVGVLWTMATLMFTLKKNFERSYHIVETRSFWTVRFIVFPTAVVALLSIALVLVLLLFGVQIARLIEQNFGYTNVFALLIRILRLPLAFVVMTFVALMLYRTIINLRQPLSEIIPGALFAGTLWFISTFGFGYYLKNFHSFNGTYGTLGVFLVLMVWMYLTALSLLIGGEVNAEIRRRKKERAAAATLLQN